MHHLTFMASEMLSHLAFEMRSTPSPPSLKVHERTLDSDFLLALVRNMETIGMHDGILHTHDSP